MKKLLFIAMVAFGFAANAQEKGEQTSEGKWVIEANTGSAATGNTSFSLTSVDGNTAWSIGLDGGYFIMDDLAIKAGLGHRSQSQGSISVSSTTYKIGAEYYIDGRFPVGVDFTGTSFDGGSANWIGLQGGYSWFLSESVSLKPAVRYNIGIEDGQKGVFQGLIGFAIHI